MEFNSVDESNYNQKNVYMHLHVFVLMFTNTACVNIHKD